MYEFSETLQTALNANNPQRVLIEFASGEQFTNEIFKEVIEHACKGVKCFLTKTNTNPIGYY